ncbi:MAG: hypothetical protein WCB11_02140 [Terriglobales bacterium]|jgi:hypothetical protein
MRKLTSIVSLLFAFVLTLGLGVSLGAPAPGAKSSATKISTKAVTKAKPPAGMTVAEHSATKTSHTLASAEDLTGTITMIDPSNKELTLVGSNGVPYDFELTKKTRIELADQKIGMHELSSESHKQATIHFVPKSDGNLAENIQIYAS